jgi:hypothetical protein
MTIKESGGKVNISMTRGDSESITVRCYEKTDGGETVFLPIEDGDTVYLTVRPDAEGEIVLQKVIEDFPDGAAVIPFAAEDTAGLDFGNYVYDIQLTRADGTVTTLLVPAKFTLKDEVTY